MVNPSYYTNRDHYESLIISMRLQAENIKCLEFEVVVSGNGPSLGLIQLNNGMQPLGLLLLIDECVIFPFHVPLLFILLMSSPTQDCP